MTMEGNHSKDRYRYQKLTRGDIRLLRFCPTHDDDLSFQILHKSFNQKVPSFAALSYFWGNENPEVSPHRVLIGNEFLPITKNLRDALVHVRKRVAPKSDRLGKTALLWVDAICIDQSDNDEKNIQLGLMSSLYIRASKIFVWLGAPKDDRDETNIRLAMEKLKYFYRLSLSGQKAAVPLRPFWWPNKLGRPDRYDMLQKFDSKNTKVFDVEGSDTHKAWLGIVQVWRSEWWKRAWILQESTVVENDQSRYYGLGPWHIWVSIPKFKVHFLYGQYTTHWVAMVLSILVADHLQTMPLLNTAFLKGAAEAARKVWNLREQRRIANEPELLELLQRYRHSHCKDPRDKVYSLLGLVSDAVRLSIGPDYNKSVIEVYLDVVVRHALAQQTPNLDFLGYAMRLGTSQRMLSPETSYASWPSWIPNWDDPLPLHPLPKLLYSQDSSEHRSLIMFKDRQHGRVLRPRPSALGNVYNASLNSKVDASILNHQLTIRGVNVDVVVDLHSYQSMSWAERQEKVNEWKRLSSNKYATNETFDVALARMQVADVQYSDAGYAVARNNSVNNALLGKATAELTPEESRAKLRMRMALSYTTQFRGLCLTKKGFLAMVPSSAKVDDRICALLGGQVLYVLRPMEGARHINKCEYIGECYVHGLMDGEVMNWVQDGKAVTEQFTLI